MELTITVCCNLCNKFSIKTIELFLIISHLLAILSFLLFFGFVKLSNIPLYSTFLLFFSLSLLIICLIFSIFLRLWRIKGEIKTIKKNISINISTAGIILIIICFFVCGINEYLILNNFMKINNLNFIRIPDFQVGILYFSFSCIELVDIMNIFFFSIIRDKIISQEKTSNSEQSDNVITGNNIYEKQKKIPENSNIIENNIQININNNQNLQYDINKNILPNIRYSYSSQQIINTQLSQSSNSQIQVYLIRPNFNSNKKLIFPIRKQNIILSTTDRKF
jgi:hypothetical protein